MGRAVTQEMGKSVHSVAIQIPSFMSRTFKQRIWLVRYIRELARCVARVFWGADRAVVNIVNKFDYWVENGVKRHLKSIYFGNSLLSAVFESRRLYSRWISARPLLLPSSMEAGIVG